jgi:hypothetical protein
MIAHELALTAQSATPDTLDHITFLSHSDFKLVDPYIYFDEGY